MSFIEDEIDDCVVCIRCKMFFRRIECRTKPQNFVCKDCKKPASVHGLTNAEYNNLLNKQNHRCAICKQPPTIKRLAVDHCHTTGKVRGLLCFNCNVGLGKFREDTALLRKAVVYLETEPTNGLTHRSHFAKGTLAGKAHSL